MRTETAVSKKSDRAAAIIDSLDEPAFVFDEAGTIVHLNRGAAGSWTSIEIESSVIDSAMTLNITVPLVYAFCTARRAMDACSSAETSCERRNEFLDRALVVATVEGIGAEFFREAQ